MAVCGDTARTERAPRPPAEMTDADLAQALLDAVRRQDFGATPDAMQGGAATADFPSLDLAVVAFPAGRPPVAANVLFSRDFPEGIVAGIGDRFGPVVDVHYLADPRDAELRSIAWLPGADWDRMAWRTLAGAGRPRRFVAPYPASLLKMLVAVGIALRVEAGTLGWPYAELEAMITRSDDAATTALVARLHRTGGIEPLQRRLSDCGLDTLRFEGTAADGGWGNAAGAGVGKIQMTAWDSARLMWLLDADAPSAPWLAPGAELVSPASRARLRGWLEAQRCNEILSSSSLRDVAGWVPGLPEDVVFAHKTGTTENYASDAGIVRARPPGRRHYIVAVLTSLGNRYAPDPRCATTWHLPALGAAIDRVLAEWLEG